MKKKYFIRYLPLLFVLFSCNHKIERRLINNDVVEAYFNKSDNIEGLAKFYSLDGNLESIANFQNGKKQGFANNYYLDGRVKDSANYENNLINGYSFSYDQSGQIITKYFNYYGLEVGDHNFYHHNSLYYYYFSNFESKKLVECFYDSLERCIQVKFNSFPVVSDLSNNNSDSAIGFFLFFPNPPKLNIKYTFGKINKYGQVYDTTVLNHKRLFIDTTLKKIDSENKYFLTVICNNPDKDTTLNLFYTTF